MSRFLSLTLGVLSLGFVSSCAYIQEGSHQNITFMTPEAHDARCDVLVNKVRYQVWPPQTINIKKSDKPMQIVCEAPGNRTVELKVEPELSEKANWGGPAGRAWDYASSSAYYYPSVIAIDFTHQLVTANKPPAHNNPDVRQPETYDLEEFSTDRMRLNADRRRADLPLLKRGEDYSDEVRQSVHEDIEVAPVSTEPEEESFSTMIEGLTSQEEGAALDVPAEDSGDVADSEPLAIFPNE